MFRGGIVPAHHLFAADEDNQRSNCYQKKWAHGHSPGIQCRPSDSIRTRSEPGTHVPGSDLTSLRDFCGPIVPTQNYHN